MRIELGIRQCLDDWVRDPLDEILRQINPNERPGPNRIKRIDNPLPQFGQMLKKSDLAAALFQSCRDGIVRLAAVGHGRGELQSRCFLPWFPRTGLRFRRSMRLTWEQLRPPALLWVRPQPDNPQPLPGGFPCQSSRSTPQATPGLLPWPRHSPLPRSSSELRQAALGAPGPASPLQTRP